MINPPNLRYLTNKQCATGRGTVVVIDQRMVAKPGTLGRQPVSDRNATDFAQHLRDSLSQRFVERKSKARELLDNKVFVAVNTWPDCC